MTKKQSVTALLHEINQGNPIDYKAPYFNEQLISVLLERKMIPENSYNHFDAKADANFLIGMIQILQSGKELTPNQMRKLDIVTNLIAINIRANQKALTERKDVWVKKQALKAERENKLPEYEDLTDEQKELIERVRSGENVLVDACIGSGKTTAIQVLCRELSDKNILYLTYNRLLKVDAQKKIRTENTFVTNYHGFAVSVLRKYGIKTTAADAIQTFNRAHHVMDSKNNPFGKKYDLIVLDEYQDVEQEIADELYYIKEKCPDAQIVAVGDMEQKIYDKTTLFVPKFIDEYLGDHSKIQFTKCFRLSKDHAAMLGDIWKKKIDGVNKNCEIFYMTEKEVESFLAEQNPGDLLCLGNRQGRMVRVLNYLEDHYPDVYNKETVYASIKDEYRDGLNLSGDTAIFTTYDASKGMERSICVVFDYDTTNWALRLGKPMQKYEILRNIFCVAASRGKEKIIFVTSERDFLTPDIIMKSETRHNLFGRPFLASEMFDHKYKEDVEECFSLLKIKKRNFKNMDMNNPADKKQIRIDTYNGLIDLSPCIGNFQSAKFFKNYDIDDVIKLQMDAAKSQGRSPRLMIPNKSPLWKKLLYLTYLETSQERYVTQVDQEFITKEQSKEICSRLKKVFSGNEEVEVPCSIDFQGPNNEQCTINGRIDVLKDDTIFELKFVNELEHKHFLQLACYILMTGAEKGVLWNVKKNEAYTVKILGKNRQLFWDCIAKTITKGELDHFNKISKYREYDLEIS